MDHVREDDLAWIRDDTAVGMTVRSLIPGRYKVYGLLDLEDNAADAVLLNTLRKADDEVLIVGWIERNSFITEPGDQHELYAHWHYRLRRMSAGELQSRCDEVDAEFPDLVFPIDRTWVISTGWDDSWRSLGLTNALAAQVELALPTFEPIAPDTDISTTGREVR